MNCICPLIGTEKECVIDGQLCSSRNLSIGILWEDDEGNELVEEFTVGDTKEVGYSLRSLLTIKEITIRGDKNEADS